MAGLGQVSRGAQFFFLGQGAHFAEFDCVEWTVANHTPVHGTGRKSPGNLQSEAGLYSSPETGFPALSRAFQGRAGAGD